MFLLQSKPKWATGKLDIAFVIQNAAIEKTNSPSKYPGERKNANQP